MEGKILYLNTKELEGLKKIGHGTDGNVYLYKDNLLIKLYHKRVKEITNDYSNDEDIKIYDCKNKCVNNYYKDDLTYYQYDEDGDENIKLLPKDAIKKAIERHDNIKLTSLPVGIVYLDERFAGCILEKKRGIQIHKLTGLPLTLKKKIYLNVLKAEAELLQNYIYHIDLSNSPYAKKMTILPNKEIITTGHSHVLVNPITLDTNFIDLDGKSTIYTEKENVKLRKLSLSSLSILTLEFLLKIDWEELKEEPQEIYSQLNEKQIPIDLQEKLINLDASLEEFHQLTKILKK